MDESALTDAFDLVLGVVRKTQLAGALPLVSRCAGADAVLEAFIADAVATGVPHPTYRRQLRQRRL